VTRRSIPANRVRHGFSGGVAACNGFTKAAHSRCPPDATLANDSLCRELPDGVTIDFKEGHGLRSELDDQESQRLRLHEGTRPVASLTRVGRRCQSHAPDVERVSHHCTLTPDALDRLQRPLHVGHIRILRAAVRRSAHPSPVSSAYRLRPSPGRLPSSRPSPSRRCAPRSSLFRRPDDSRLRRLRLRGLIERADGTHRYHVTPCSVRVIFFLQQALRIFVHTRPRLSHSARPSPTLSVPRCSNSTTALIASTRRRPLARRKRRSKTWLNRYDMSPRS
jgi:hypothetical protein